jgi:hypothetical protein
MQNAADLAVKEMSAQGKRLTPRSNPDRSIWTATVTDVIVSSLEKNSNMDWFDAGCYNKPQRYPANRFSK